MAYRQHIYLLFILVVRSHFDVLKILKSTNQHWASLVVSGLDFPVTHMVLHRHGLSLNVVLCHIPYSTEWAEPDRAYSSDFQRNVISKEESQARLAALRSVMSQQNIHAYIIPTADAHGSQYIAPSDARRQWISGFQGSAGSAIVTMTDALLFTDARYFLQFEIEVDTESWDLMRPGIEPTMQNWLVANMEPGSVVGVDPTTYTRNEWVSMQNALNQVNVTLMSTSKNLVDIARDDHGDPAPSRPSQDLMPLPRNYTGRAAGDKVAELLQQIRSRNAVALVLSALDDIAYTLNLRGSDIPYNPVFFSYLILRADLNESNIIFFWGNGTLPVAVSEFLATEGLQIDARPYEKILEYLSEIGAEEPGRTIWLTQTGSQALYVAAESEGRATVLTTLSPVVLMKTIKNEVELRGFRNAHIKDGIAVVRTLRWVHEQVDAGVNVTEIDVSNKLIEFRSLEDDFMGPSFATIAGTGSNGAIIHYRPSEQNQRVIERFHMLLIDSGGQYRDGTTDITRTRHMSYYPTDKQRSAFTRVLKGQISLGTAVFPRGITGNVLETLARKSLWDVGLNYGHGTGHGVGHFLNVHEGPSGILSSPIATDPGIAAGMVFSNEPGFYEEGEYGIRHEDLVEVIELKNTSNHIRAPELEGDFAGVGALAFSYLSLVPHQTACLDVNLLSDFEIEFINKYHNRVLITLGDILIQRNLTEDYVWLVHECAPIYKSSAILFKISPILVLFSLFTCFG